MSMQGQAEQARLQVRPGLLRTCDSPSAEVRLRICWNCEYLHVAIRYDSLVIRLLLVQMPSHCSNRRQSSAEVFLVFLPSEATATA